MSSRHDISVTNVVFAWGDPSVLKYLRLTNRWHEVVHLTILPPDKDANNESGQYRTRIRQPTNVPHQQVISTSTPTLTDAFVAAMQRSYWMRATRLLSVVCKPGRTTSYPGLQELLFQQLAKLSHTLDVVVYRGSLQCGVSGPKNRHTPHSKVLDLVANNLYDIEVWCSEAASLPGKHKCGLAKIRKAFTKNAERVLALNLQFESHDGLSTFNSKDLRLFARRPLFPNLFELRIGGSGITVEEPTEDEVSKLDRRAPNMFALAIGQWYYYRPQKPVAEASHIQTSDDAIEAKAEDADDAGYDLLTDSTFLSPSLTNASTLPDDLLDSVETPYASDDASGDFRPGVSAVAQPTECSEYAKIVVKDTETETNVYHTGYVLDEEGNWRALEDDQYY